MTEKERKIARWSVSFFVVVVVLTFLFPGEPETAQPDTFFDVPDPQPRQNSDPVRTVIDEWLILWSTAQTASIHEVCEAEPGCDPDKYTPEARPETTFGWNGAQQIERTADWARGTRYRVRANGRLVLVYLEHEIVVGVHIIPDDGPRRSLCRDADCYP